MPPNAVGRRAAAPHRIVDPVAGDLIGVKLHILIQKTLGGIQTDLVLARPGLIADAMFKQPAVGLLGGCNAWKISRAM